MRKTIAALLVLFVTTGYTANMKVVDEVYKNLTNANGFNWHPDMEYSDDKEVNAYYDSDWGGGIHFQEGMIRFVRNKNEIAWVIGHEWAHSRLHSGGTWQSEMDADRWGMTYMKKAGYNACSGIKVLLRFEDSGDAAHPPSAQRYNALKGVCK